MNAGQKRPEDKRCYFSYHIKTVDPAFANFIPANDFTNLGKVMKY